jgi:uncharacterized protein (TIGR04255 family)
LKLVACEVAFPPVPRFDTTEGQHAAYEALRDEFPIVGQQPQINIEVGPAGARQETRGARFLDRRRTKSVVLLSTAIALETSAYVRFEDFAEVVAQVLEALHDLANIPGVLRVGLRYIDEIEVPGVEAPTDWAEYVTPDLLAPSRPFEDLELTEYQGALQFSVAERHAVGVRFGLHHTPVVDPNGPLRIERSPTHTYFLLDVDSAWTATPEEMPPFSLDEIAELLERLHHPVRDIFERAITERLRDEVLRKEPA